MRSWPSGSRRGRSLILAALQRPSANDDERTAELPCNSARRAGRSVRDRLAPLLDPRGAGEPDQLAPVLDLLRDELRELVRRSRCARDEAHFVDQLLLA